MKNQGFTLIETVISLGVFMLITLSIVNMLAYTSKAAERMTVRAELLEAARISMDMLTVHIKAADKVEISNDLLAGSVTKIEITNYDSTDPLRVFDHFPRLLPHEQYYHRIWFGGNELANHIKRLDAYLTGDILSLTVTTDAGTTDDRTSTDAKTTTEPVILTSKIKVHGNVKIK